MKLKNTTKNDFNLTAVIALGIDVAKLINTSQESIKEKSIAFYGALVAHYGADAMAKPSKGGLNLQKLKDGAKPESIKAECSRVGLTSLQGLEIKRINRELRAVCNSAWANVQDAFFGTGPYATKEGKTTGPKQVSPEVMALNAAKVEQNHAQAAILLADSEEAKTTAKARYDAARAKVHAMKTELSTARNAAKLSNSIETLQDLIQQAIDTATKQGRTETVVVLRKALLSV